MKLKRDTSLKNIASLKKLKDVHDSFRRQLQIPESIELRGTLINVEIRIILLSDFGSIQQLWYSFVPDCSYEVS